MAFVFVLVLAATTLGTQQDASAPAIDVVWSPQMAMEGGVTLVVGAGRLLFDYDTEPANQDKNRATGFDQCFRTSGCLEDPEMRLGMPRRSGLEFRTETYRSPPRESSQNS